MKGKRWGGTVWAHGENLNENLVKTPIKKDLTDEM